MTNQNTHNVGLPFLKMHGLGNDFVIVDARKADNPITPAVAKAIGSRFFGVGFDQLAVLRETDDADIAVDFWNSDGSTADACGNASRCVARLVMEETGDDSITLQTGFGLLPVVRVDADNFSVNMGQPQLTWDTVPLARDVDLNALPIEGEPGAAGMGNPHCVFVVDDAEAVDLPKIGPVMEHHELYPERTNVEFINIINRNHIRMRVWERGGMITLACGSGACGAVVVAHRKGLTDRNVQVDLDGGTLHIDWREDGVWMTGPTALVFSGELSAEFLSSIDG
ncbi:diaminopimelate epimerase [Amylibacter sp. SFDW26]|uniref:diaminopimelate epimerase n=1 Tax=Amylibacter sp. SFDW26 TaxID=2652722 RepID=UPI0012625181|nr:diaminopimelate epimerase [Amylibacter sp. SFDW26]KAB7614709.1 diaminopimelate epimerase [Amylibacter sp. SFDW26]